MSFEKTLTSFIKNSLDFEKLDLEDQRLITICESIEKSADEYLKYKDKGGLKDSAIRQKIRVGENILLAIWGDPPYRTILLGALYNLLNSDFEFTHYEKEMFEKW